MKAIKLNEKIYKYFGYFFLFTRIVIPLFIFVNPFIFPIICQLIDSFDYIFLTNGRIVKNTNGYQLIDKVLDFYYLLIMFVVSIMWGNMLLIALFVYRLIGFLAVFLTKKRIFFVVFPNFFEWVFNILSFGYVYNDDFLSFFNNNLIYFLLPIFFIKIGVELYIHFFDLNISNKIFGVKVSK